VRFECVSIRWAIMLSSTVTCCERSDHVDPHWATSCTISTLCAEIPLFRSKTPQGHQLQRSAQHKQHQSKIRRVSRTADPLVALRDGTGGSAAGKATTVQKRQPQLQFRAATTSSHVRRQMSWRPTTLFRQPSLAFDPGSWKSCTDRCARSFLAAVAGPSSILRLSQATFWASLTASNGLITSVHTCRNELPDS